MPLLASSLSNYLRGLTTPTPTIVRRMATFFDVPESEIERLLPRDGERALMVPVVEQHAGAGASGTADVEYVPYTPPPEFRGHRFLGARVVGGCLEPELREGHIAIYDLDAEPRPGDFVVAVRDGTETLVKILEEKNGRLRLVALQDFEPIDVDGAVQIVGVVVGAFYRPGLRRRRG